MKRLPKKTKICAYQQHLSIGVFPRRERRSIQKRDLRSNATCSKMNLNGTAVLDWAGCRRNSVHARGPFDKHVDCGVRAVPLPERDDGGTFCFLLAHTEITQIHCCAPSRLSELAIAAAR